jgi:hypothetical protein
MGAQFFISAIFGTMHFMDFYPSSSSLPKKDPLRMKVMEEIGSAGKWEGQHA